MTDPDEAMVFHVPEGTAWVQTDLGAEWYRRLAAEGRPVERLDYPWVSES